jgi:hypothetical protein
LQNLYRWNDFAGGEEPGGDKKPTKRKSMKALDDVILIIKGTVEGRGGAGGVQYTQQECCTIYEHWTDNGVGGMIQMGQ